MPVSLASAPATTHGAVVPIAYTSLSTGASDVYFSNIPSGYQDLMVVAYARRSDAATNAVIYISPQASSSPATAYSRTALAGDGSSASSARNSNQDAFFAGIVPAASATSGIFGSTVVHILNYANTSTFKTILSRGAYDLNGSGGTNLNVGLLRNTNAVNQIWIGTFSSATYVAGSTFALYGIRGVNQ